MTNKAIKDMFHTAKLQITKNAVDMIQEELAAIVRSYVKNAKANKLKRITRTNSEYWRYSFGQLVTLMKKRKEL